jgi:TolA-binding protein
MRKSLLLMAVVCLLVADIQIVSARDVQLRSRSGDATSTLGVPSNANTQQLSTEERVKRLERILDSQGLVDMLLRIENLQNELQILRGEIELHNHELEQIKQRQRDLYVDIDRRLLRMERNGVQPGAAVAPAQGKSATASSTPSSPAASKSAQRKFSQAIKDYQKLIDKYPKSPKLAEAMLKIGYSQYELKNYKQAESTLKNLAQNYPGTTEAGQAQNLIQKIRINHRK